jgi:DNA mismatch repair protein MutL
MPSIHIIPEELKNKIAAGEVIERPASVVKELIENSIDAMSSEIIIDIINGGKRLIRVSDNGTGMDREDALLCFQRHATSKLLKEEDLFNIKTLGFRGEALSSIASVSNMKIMTGTKKLNIGTSIELTGGNIKEIKEIVTSGTTIEVRDLFFNTPARKKFLKKNATELYHIIDIITKESLSHWWISFKLRSDNKLILDLPSSTCYDERILNIYGKEFLDKLIRIKIQDDNITMDAFISNIDNLKNTRTHQFIFINNRPIKDQLINHAVYSAYDGLIPRDKQPIFFIFLKINPEKIDVNVHPTKREVRLDDKEMVYQFIKKHIKSALVEKREQFVKEFLQKNIDIHKGLKDPQTLNTLNNLHTKSILEVSENFELNYKTSLPFINIGDTFIAISGKAGLTLIDFHAAHERILFERFLKGIDLTSSQLLFPKQIQLPLNEYKTIVENSDILMEFGIHIEDFGQNTIIIRSLPDVLIQADIESILLDIASFILKERTSNIPIKKSIAAKLACHSSLRGMRILSQEEVNNLITELEKTENPEQCPHGRPTRIFFSLDELKKMFKKK